MWILHPTAEDVKRLDDGQLVELALRLCRREAQSLEIAATAVTQGGHSAAKDGGIDIRVAGSLRPAGELQGLPAGIQVKAQLMPPPEIRTEMSPKGVLRPSITGLLKAGGTYIIASGREDLTDKRRQELIAAMVGQVPAAHRDQVAFLDSRDLATWCVRHPGVAAWLRSEVKRPLDGWEPWGPWSARNEPEDQAYLVDQAARLCRPTLDEDHLHGALVGMGLVREALAGPASAVRLTGLSGMGKTRFAQALFDRRVGDGALDPALAIYGDAGFDKSVSPAQLARSLVDDQVEAVLIVDNCLAARHRELVEIVRQPGSRVRLLTIDYDVGDDQPDHTEVFRLQNAGEDLIDALLLQRAPTLAHAERIRIIEFAGGNTRIALAIALAPRGAKGIVGLKNEELLDRLFLKDRRDPDVELRRVARAAALVYAFSIEGAEVAEGVALTALAGVSDLVFHEKIADLLERGLAQKRGDQRAVLPPAIAAWLAAEALAKLPRNHLMTAFGIFSPRLQLSFARRLGLLQGVKAATEIAQVLLGPGGRFSSPVDDNGHDMRAVRYLAPLAPILALDVADRLVADGRRLESWHPLRGELRRLLVEVAYDAEHFDQAVELLARLALREGPDERSFESIRDKILPMFHIQRSGTHATPAQRFAAIDRWLSSDDPHRRSLGLTALGAALETRFAGADPQIEYGAERRNSGWWPKDRAELRDWFAEALVRVRRLLADPDTLEKGRKLAAAHYPSLAGYPVVVPAAVETMRVAAGGTFWPKGWFAACDALWRLRKKKRSRPVIALEREMRPVSLADEVEVWLRLDWHDWRNPQHADQSRDDWPEAHRRALAAGAGVGIDDDIARRVLADPSYEARYLGQGLAQSLAPTFQPGWDRLRRLLAEIRPDKPNWSVFAGYLGVVRSQAPELADALLDAAMADDVLRPFAIVLCVTDGDTNDRGLARILTLLRDPKTTPEERRSVFIIRFDETLKDARQAELIDALVAADEPEQALTLLGYRDRDGDWEPPLREAARRLLAKLELSRRDDPNGLWDRRAAKVAERSLSGPEGEAAAASLLDRIIALGEDRRGRIRGLPRKLTKALFRLHPRMALDAFLPALIDDRRYALRSLVDQHDDDDQPARSLFNAIPDDVIRPWLAEDPVARGAILADLGSYFEHGAEGRFEWTPLARMLIEIGNTDILDILGNRFESGSWSGRRDARFVSRRPLVEALQNHPDARVRAWAEEMLAYLDSRISQRSEWDREPPDRFE
ncbi:hypothetical protein [Brevundimonas mediterranea]|uniref:Uncharacterized protein n=1 Tax=Brevundimonas mediterranea TaxID=74329 RepID=A0A7W6A4Q1_9CAUL|nr:hypothetical protein [Brevundimonas mediterranea]MBB3871657.1 hypothetical protein [Brevundimonas mediterranea]